MISLKKIFFQDDFPLASLPLLGYSVRKPDPQLDQIQKDFVFKLQFKNHVYFFRAESEYTFERWLFTTFLLFLLNICWSSLSQDLFFADFYFSLFYWLNYLPRTRGLMGCINKTDQDQVKLILGWRSGSGTWSKQYSQRIWADILAQDQAQL